MYLNYYGFHSEPFHVTPDPERLFPSETHREALAALIYGVQQRKGFIALTGEVGLGKTTVLRAFLDVIDQEGLKIIYLMNPTLEFDDLLASLFEELDLGERPASSAAAIRILFEELIDCYRRDEGVVLVIDEAQTVPVQTLERLRLLSNLETSSAKLLQIVLAGQPELDALLAEDRLRQLNQRIAVRVRLRPLTQDESLEYIRHRIERAANHDETVMTTRAQKAIARAAEGVPRLLNVLCDNAFITGYGYGKRPVDLGVAREIIHDNKLMVVHPRRSPPPPRRRYGLLAATAACLATIALAAAYALSQVGMLDWPLATEARERAGLAGSAAQFEAERRSENGAQPGRDAEEGNAITTSGELMERLRDLQSDLAAAAQVDVVDHATSGEAVAGESAAIVREELYPPNAPEPGEQTLASIARGGPATASGGGDNAAMTEEIGAPLRLGPMIAERPQVPSASAGGQESSVPAFGASFAPGQSLPEGPVASGAMAGEGGYLIRTVRRGENLWAMIEAVYGEATPQRLREVVAANPGLRDIHTIVPGQQIVFPGAVLTASTETVQGN